MEGDMLESIWNPFSNNVPSLDFIFNHHFMNKALFGNKFDPLTNDYLIGFWLAVFSTTMTNNRYLIPDVLFGVLGDNNGFKTLTVLPRKASNSKTLLLVQNFFFNSDPRRIKHGGLSEKERRQVNCLLGIKYEEKIVQYRLNDLTDSVCPNRSDEMRYRPFMELLLDLAPSDNNAPGQVRKFFQLKSFSKFWRSLMQHASTLERNGHNEVDIKKIIQSIENEYKNGSLNMLIGYSQAPSQFGFLHGFLFSSYDTHKHDVKVRAFGRGKEDISLILQKQLFAKDLRDFRPAASYDLNGDQRILDTIENFKEKIIQTIAKEGNKTETRDLLTLYVRRLLSSIGRPSSKSRGLNYMRTYLLGMFMTWPGPSSDYTDKSPFYNVYSTNEYMQIALLKRYKCLLVFNFDPNTPLNGPSLKLAQFHTAIRENCIWIASIFGRETQCSNMLVDKDVIYDSNVTLFNSVDIAPKYSSYDYKPLPETNFVRHLLLGLDLSDEEVLNDIFHGFKQVVLAVRDVLKRDKTAFFHILEGLFHDKSSYFTKRSYRKHQIDILRSMNVFCLRIELDGKITQLNFMSVDHVAKYKQQVGSMEREHQVINFYHEYDSNRGNFGAYMDFLDETFTRSSCYNSTGGQVECAPISHIRFKKSKRSVLVPTYKFFVDVFHRLQVNVINNGDVSKALMLQNVYTSLLIDDLSNPFYALGDLIWTKILIHDTKALVDSFKPIKTAWKVGKITLKAVRSGVGVPIIGAYLSVKDTIAAWENYQNGDKSAFAVFNIVAGVVFTVTSLISLTIDIMALAGFAVVPVIGWIVFAVGTAFYIIQNIWKIIDDVEGFKQFAISCWELVKSIPDILRNPIQYLESEPMEKTYEVVNRALEIMDNNAVIQNVISTPICDKDVGPNRACLDIHINFNERFRYLKKNILSDTPQISGKFVDKYKKLCTFQAALGVVEILRKITNPHAYIMDYACVNALAVGRKTNPLMQDPVSLYMLHGNSTVYAIRDTVSIFGLSGGNSCNIDGGQRESMFVFSSSFQKCLIIGHEYSVNTADLSELDSLNNYKIKGGTSLEGVNTCKGRKSAITMRNIGVIATRQHFDDTELEIICSNISIVVKKREQDFFRPYGIKVSRGYDCPYNLEITSHGSVNIDNRATNGKTVYTFPDVTGEVAMYLNNNGGRMSHIIMWESINITEIRNLYMVAMKRDMMIYQFGFTFKDYGITLTLRNGTNSTQLIFADGAQLTLKNNTFIVDMLFPKSKGQLWDMYSLFFDNLGGSYLELNAYSERDDEFFTLNKNEIRFNRTTMPFSFFTTKSNESIIKCRSGYNIILIKTEDSRHNLDERAPWFDSFAIEMMEKPDILLIDLTPLTDSLNNFKNNPIMEIKLTQHHEEQQATLDVFLVLWSEGVKATYPMGQISLKSNLIDNALYKKIKIKARFDFILTKDDSSNLLEVVPLPVDISPLSPVMVLDRHSVEENQVILFSDRLLLNYNLVKLDDSTLVITNLVSNLARSLVITQTSVPLLSIIINNYNDSGMRSLTLKFEPDLTLNIGQLDENRMLPFFEFKERLSVMEESMSQEESSFEHDTRVRSSTETVDSLHIEKSGAKYN